MVKNSNRHYLTDCTTAFYKESDGSTNFLQIFLRECFVLSCTSYRQNLEQLRDSCTQHWLSCSRIWLQLSQRWLSCILHPNKYPTSIPQVRSMIMAIGKVKWPLYCFPNLFAKILRYSISFCNIVLSKMLSLGIASPYSSL